MNEINPKLEPFIQHRALFLVRGFLLSAIGFCVLVLSIINPNFRIMSTIGWLPVIAFSLIATGVLESIDAYVARKSTVFLVYSHLAILDLVTGIVILFELHNNPKNLALLTTVYLCINGLFRIVAALNMNLPNNKSLILTGFVPFILGLILWQGVPEDTVVAFISSAIALDITMRGFVLVWVSFWFQKLNRCLKSNREIHA